MAIIRLAQRGAEATARVLRAGVPIGGVAPSAPCQSSILCLYAFVGPCLAAHATASCNPEAHAAFAA
eukprot:344994-Chlamydomonas_euryale.AAC.3